MKSTAAFFISLFTVLFYSTHSFANKVLVFEFELPNEEIPHVDLVSSVACADPNLVCEIIYENAFNVEILKSFKEKLAEIKPASVNMSFAFEAPQINGSPSVGTGYDYDTQREEFAALKGEMLGIITDADDVLFSIAAGNGKGASGPMTPGVPLGFSNELYPAIFEVQNVVRVSSIETDKIETEINKLESYTIADYANYSVFKVELATHVERWKDGKLLKGTSFSAPVVARLTASLKKLNPKLTALQIKEIMMKSAYVQEIDSAIKWSKEWNEKGRESLLFKVHAAYKRTKRNNLIKGLGGIMLVKSGGPLVEEVAYQCANNFKNSLGLLSITQACLQAHEDRLSSSKERLGKLKQLWNLRNF